MPDLPKVRVVIYSPPTERYYSPNKEDLGPFLDDGPVLNADGIQSSGLNDQGDILKRLEYLINQIKKAETNLKDDPKVLRLFVAPEWFFRRKDRPYYLKEATTMLDELLKESLSPPLNSWMIVPGTILWGDKTGEKWTIYNVAPVVCDGKLLSLVHKDQEGSDIPEGENGNYNWGIYDVPIPPRSADNSPEALEERKKKVHDMSVRVIKELGKPLGDTDTQGYFSCRNIQFGLCICADQNSPRLKKLVVEKTKQFIKKKLGIDLQNDIQITSDPTPENKGKKKKKPKTTIPEKVELTPDLENFLHFVYNANMVHINLLVSCGAGFTPKNASAKTGGFLIQSDGKIRNQSNNFCAQVKRNPKFEIDKYNFPIQPKCPTFPVLEKRVFPSGSTDPLSRLFFYDELLDFNPPTVSNSLQSTSAKATQGS
ncbi:MAG: hypothetical protein H6563_11225 [Lewinellaceae bacterium]|nr:hypothetical protein [Lewinellaceae bacterium]